MAGILKVLAILIMYRLIGVKSQYENPCTQPNYERCVRDLNPLVQTAQTYYIKYTIARMGELCREYMITKACIQKFEQHCHEDTQKEIQSTHAYYEYICDNNFKVFATYRDCLVKPELEARAHSCNSTFFQSITRASTVPGRLCGHIKAFIDCLSTEVRLECGQEAAEWQLGLDKAVHGPIIASSRCSLELEKQSYCTNDNLDRCFAPLYQHPIRDGSHLVPTHIDIVAICKSYTEVRPCIDLLIYECHPHHQRHLQSLHDSYKYVCDDTLQEYLNHRDCLATPELHSELTHCDSSFEKELESVDYSGDTVQSKYASICQHANTMLDCIEGQVDSFCGRDAADWQRGLHVASYKPILDYFECEISATSASTGLSPKTISAIVIPAAVLLIVMVAALLLICRCIKKNKKESNAHLPMMNEVEMAQSSPRVVYTVPPPVSAQEPGAMAALPPDLLPPEYTEKPQFGEMLLAAAIAYQSPDDDVKPPLPPDDEADYATVTPSDVSNTRGSVLQPPEYEDVDLGQGGRSDVP